jgi:uncharacterized protein (DUF433 family)
MMHNDEKRRHKTSILRRIAW